MHDPAFLTVTWQRVSANARARIPRIALKLVLGPIFEASAAKLSTAQMRELVRKLYTS